jgi:hypothetical protein
MYRNRSECAVRALRAVAMAAICLSATGAAAGPGGVHPFRLTVTDADVFQGSLEARIRFFWDDLQLAIMEHASDMEFKLAETEEVDAIIESYINETLVMTVGDAVLEGRVTARGIEDAARIDEVMWWYRLHYDLPRETERVSIRNRLLFNMFEDQRNLVNLKTRGGRERTYYFSWDEDNITVPVG